MTRSDDRDTFDDPGRIRLLESDLDRIEDGIDEIRDALSSFRAEVRRESKARDKILVGILSSLTVGALLFAINIVFLFD